MSGVTTTDHTGMQPLRTNPGLDDRGTDLAMTLGVNIESTIAGIRALLADALAGVREAAETAVDLCEAVIRHARKAYWHASMYDRLWFVREAAPIVALLAV